jgi:flagella basal body P-ring formation protein FlgA
MMRALVLLLCGCLAFAQEAAARLAETAVAYAEIEAAKLSGEWHIKLAQPPRVPTQLGPGAFDVRPLLLSKREPCGRFFVVLDLWQDGKHVGQSRVDLEGTWKGRLYHLKQAVTRKTELTEDVVESYDHEGVPPEGAVTDLPKGFRFRGPLPAGRVLHRSDLEAIPLIQPGDTVKVVARGEGAEVRREAIARSAGGMGERIRLEASGTHRVIQAKVTGPGEAEVSY